MTTTYQLPMFARLEPLTPWTGGRLADTDVVTLDEAARFASKHAGAEITPADFLRAGARGEILMRAICPRAATMEPSRETDKPLTMPENCIPTLPLDACKALSNTGRAKWRTIDGFENVETFGGELGRFTRWQLPDSEPDLVTTPDDCRVIGRDVHALADAFIDKPAPAQDTATPAPTEPENASGAIKLLPENEPMRNAATGPVFSMTKAAMVAQHEHEWPSILGDMKVANTNGLADAKAGPRGWHESDAMAWARSNNKLTSAAESAAELTQAMRSMGNLSGHKHKL